MKTLQQGVDSVLKSQGKIRRKKTGFKLFTFFSFLQAVFNGNKKKPKVLEKA